VKVPLKNSKGQIIGSAEVSKDGSFTATFDEGVPGKDISAMLISGNMKGMCIVFYKKDGLAMR
jgi:hypothetical protein